MDKQKEIPPHQVKIKEVVAEFRKSVPNATKKELDSISACTGALLARMRDVAFNSSNRNGNGGVKAEATQAETAPITSSKGHQAPPAPKAVRKSPAPKPPVHASPVAHSLGAVALAESPQSIAEEQVAVEKPVTVPPSLSVVKPAPQKLPEPSLKEQLSEIFSPQKIVVRSVHDETRTDGELDRLALQLGKDFNTLREPLRIMNSSYAFKGKGEFFLPKYVPDKKLQEHVMSFFNYAQKMLLITYKTRRTHSGPFITFTIHDNKLFRKFLTGDWFERYVYTTVVNKCEILKGKSLIARNVKIKFSDGKDAELDMVIHFQGNLYVLETKTRKYIDAVMKFKNYADKFKIPNDHIFFVMLQREGNDHKGLEAFHEIRFLIVSELLPELNRQFGPKS